MTRTVFTVAEVARQLGLSTEQVLKNLAACGMKDRDQQSRISEQEYQALKTLHAAQSLVASSEPLTNAHAKRRTMLQVAAGGKKNIVKVEIRKKRVYTAPIPKVAAQSVQNPNPEHPEISTQAPIHEGTSLEIERPALADAPILSAAETVLSGVGLNVPISDVLGEQPDLVGLGSDARASVRTATQESSLSPSDAKGTPEATRDEALAEDIESVDTRDQVRMHEAAENDGIASPKVAAQRPALAPKSNREIRTAVLPPGAPRLSAGDSDKERTNRGSERHVRKKSRASEVNLKVLAKRLIVNPNLDSESLDEVISEALTESKRGPVERYSTPKNAPVTTGKLGQGKSLRSDRSEVSASERLQQRFIKPVAPVRRSVQIRPGITVVELADAMAVKASEVLKCLIKLGYFLNVNASLEADVAELVVGQFSHTATVSLNEQDDLETQGSEEALLSNKDRANGASARHRSPVVVVIGHVDHGKTSLLDYIRHSRVAHKEVGGITQHLGAYPVSLPKGTIVFLDTPGHSAFTQMRARGAQVTDIAILVVAADDGIMPQTIEAIQHLKAADVPLVVAVTKIDKVNQRSDTLKKLEQELLKYEVVSDQLGGQTPILPVSSKTGEGITELLEALLLQAEFMGLTAVVDKVAAGGVVLEARVDKGRGISTTLLLQQGRLRRGDIVVCGLSQGRVRIVESVFGETLAFAEPTLPVVIYGLDQVPQPGDRLFAIENEKKAKNLAKVRQSQLRTKRLEGATRTNLDRWMQGKATANEGPEAVQNQPKVLNLVIKADTQGSLEAIKHLLLTQQTAEVTVTLRGYGVGNFNESDLLLAAASKAFLVGFNVGCDSNARVLIEQHKLEVEYFRVIYDLANAIEARIEQLLTPVTIQKCIGTAQIRALFKSQKLGSIAGCFIQEGKAARRAMVKLLRNGELHLTTAVESLRKGKEVVSEVTQGFECGIGLKHGKDILVGDILEFYEESI